MNKLLERYRYTRELTLKLVNNLEPEDTVSQPIEDTSPPKWHLAHTTWFFENFILKIFVSQYQVFHPQFDFLFNSYYQSQGERIHRNSRGLHPRPLFKEVLEYRSRIDEQMYDLVSRSKYDKKLHDLIELGIQHEQQHQELLLTDLKYLWSLSPLFPIYATIESSVSSPPGETGWLRVAAGNYRIGMNGDDFHFDNESPEHTVYVDSYEISSRTVTVGEYLEFVTSGNYKNWKQWLHEGWQWLEKTGTQAPLYWIKPENKWKYYTLHGLTELNLNEPVTHISFYEAEAYARWKGYRLPTEQEWEIATKKFHTISENGNYLENFHFHPRSLGNGSSGFLGNVWEWCYSAYDPYPGYKPWEGSIGEYNGKFMVNQMVLRGGSCVTPKNHIRTTYRNFFHPWAQWQFSGIRLVRNTISK